MKYIIRFYKEIDENNFEQLNDIILCSENDFLFLIQLIGQLSQTIRIKKDNEFVCSLFFKGKSNV